MSKIQIVYAREILDSQGLPTVECMIWLDNGLMVESSVPAGVSKSKSEAIELTDHDPSRMAGQGVLQAVSNINTLIGPQLVGQDPLNQTELDQLLINLDGTKNKSKLGANAILAVSQAIAKAGAVASGMPLYKYFAQRYQLTTDLSLPVGIYGLISGGSQGADNLDIQEFQIIPASFLSFHDSVSMAVTLYHQLEQVLITKGAIHSVGAVGGFAPNLYNNADAFEILIETIKASPFTFAQDVFFGVDMEANFFFENDHYILKDKSKPYAADELLEYYQTLRKQYHVFYIEDPFQEDDWQSWQKLTQEMGDTTIISGDNLLSMDEEKLKKAIQEQSCNSINVKPNQVGTITETLNVIKLAKSAGWQVVVSHRTGETNDPFLADLAVGVGAQYVRFGAPNRGERVSKYNRLLQIEDQILRARNA